MKSTLEEPQINLTPLIDVVFVILVMFIVIAPLLELDQVELAPGLPSETPLTSHESSPIAIHVYADNTIAFNKLPVTLDDLKMHLSAAHQRFPDKKPQVFHDQKATFGTYQRVKNIVESVGFEEMDVILKPE